MTDKLHCPFCGAELLGSLNEKYCTNRECEHYMRTIPTSIWQALIQAKQDLEQSKKCCSAWETQALDYKAETIALSGKLEIARKALKEIDWCAQDYAKAQETLDKITALEQKD